MKKKWIYIIVAIIAIAIFGKFVGKNEKPKTEENAKVTEVTKSESNGIPGSNPVDIYLNLEKKGYKIDKQFGNGDKFWYCDKKENGIDYNVTIYSTKVDNIENVKASANINGDDPSKQIVAVKPFISFIATLPYTGNEPEKVKLWIEENFNKDGASITIGQAKFSLFSKSKFTRLLTIEKAQ